MEVQHKVYNGISGIKRRNNEFFTCRRVLSIIVFLGFILQFTLRMNISIAIVDMTAKNSSNIISTTNELRFEWDAKEKNDILGCFFWGYMIASIPGGRLSEIYGSRKVLGICMLMASLLTILTPIACYQNYYWVIAVRATLGLMLGVAFPSLPPIASKWIPLRDRSKFMSHAAASFLGTALTMTVSGYLITHLEWPSVFYLSGGISLIWTLAWFYLVYDSPAQHPRISQNEREFLEKEIKTEKHLAGKNSISWLKILSSKAVSAIIVANACVTFNIFFVVNQLPSYMNQVLDYDMEQNGLLSSLPSLALYSTAVISCYLADRWIKNGTFSVTTTRKIFTSIDLDAPALFFLIQSFWGYNRIVSLIVFTLSLGFLGCYNAGHYSNCVDISPVYSGTIFGIANVCGGLSGYLSTKIVALLTNEKQDFMHWRYVFWILIVVNVIGTIYYLIFASAKLQKWNPKCNEEEMK